MPPRIAIVGAGLAGLQTAWRLRRAGADVVVLESGRRPGGRFAGEVREGCVLEPGGQRVSTHDAALLRLLRELGHPEALLPLRSAGAGLLRGGWIHELQAPPGPSLWRRARLRRLLARFRAQLDPAAPERAAPQDDRSLADFARLYLGSRALERWLGPLARDWGIEAEDASRVLFLLHASRRGGRGAVPALLREGAMWLPETLARGFDVRFGAEVTEVRDGLVSFREGAAEGTVGADAVVMATPAPVTAAVCAPLLAPAERDVLGSIDYAPAVVLLAALDDPVVPRLLHVRAAASEPGPLAQLWLEPGRREGRVADGWATIRLVARSDWSAAHLDAPDDGVEKELLASLARLKLVPEGRLRRVEIHRWQRAFPRFCVGRYRSLARLARVEVDRRAAGRRLYLAGDYRIAPTAEGALCSGLRAAEAVAADLGL